MTDRELLELAAKAAGLDGHRYCEAWKEMAEYDPVEGCFHSDSWNPIQDDGDALRLAVKLGLCVYPLNDIRRVGVRIHSSTMGGKYDEVEDYGNDPIAATRRAIVRAAAEIGKTMP